MSNQSKERNYFPFKFEDVVIIADGNVQAEINNYKHSFDSDLNNETLSLSYTMFNRVNRIFDNSLIVIVVCNNEGFRSSMYQTFINDGFVSSSTKSIDSDIINDEMTYNVTLLNDFDVIPDDILNMSNEDCENQRKRISQKIGQDIFKERNVQWSAVDKAYLLAMSKYLHSVILPRLNIAQRNVMSFTGVTFIGNGQELIDVASYKYSINEDKKGVIELMLSSLYKKQLLPENTIIMSIINRGYWCEYQVFRLDSLNKLSGTVSIDYINNSHKISYTATLLSDTKTIPKDVIDMSNQEFEALRLSYEKKYGNDLFKCKKITPNIANRMYLKFMYNYMNNMKRE